MGTVARDVLEQLGRRHLLPPPCDPAHPVAAVDCDDLRGAFRGAMLGTAIGDALGRPAEGRHPADVERRHGRLSDYQPWRGWRSGPVGTVTDDTQMTICVAECVIEHSGRIDPADLARRFVAWLPVGRGKGRTCVEAVEHLESGVAWHDAGRPSAGNGAAMRVAPVGLAGIGSLDRLRHDAALSAVVTHADPTAVVSAVTHAWLVARLAAMRPGRLDAPALVGELCAMLADLHDPGIVEREWQHRPGKSGAPVRLAERLVEVVAWVDASPADASAFFYSGALVLESLPMALWHFLRAPDDPEEAIVSAVMGGYDADTIASMTGAYVGAYLGDGVLPERWTGPDLEHAALLRDLADTLFELTQGGHDPT